MFKVVGSLQSKSTRRDVGTATRLFIPQGCSELHTILHNKLTLGKEITASPPSHLL